MEGAGEGGAEPGEGKGEAMTNDIAVDDEVIPADWGHMIADPNWRVGHPYEINGRKITVYQADNGWGWMIASLHRGSLRIATEREATLSAIEACVTCDAA